MEKPTILRRLRFPLGPSCDLMALKVSQGLDHGPLEGSASTRCPPSQKGEVDPSSFQTKSWNIACARPRDSPDSQTSIPISRQSLNSLILRNNRVGKSGHSGKHAGLSKLQPPLLPLSAVGNGTLPSCDNQAVQCGHLP